jgi:putative ABC transport system substrate-binding protein
MAVSADPVADGLVASLARPGGNLTGMSIMTPELTARRLQLLAEIVPGLSRVGLLLDTKAPRWPTELQEHEAAARSLNLHLQPLKVDGVDDFPAAFEAARRSQLQAVLMVQSPQFVVHRARLAALAMAHRLPCVSGSGDAQFARAGGLMNYGANIAVSWQRAATHVQRILQGAKPAELPIEQPSRFELTVNARTAEALGLTLPPQVLLLADEVIR